MLIAKPATFRLRLRKHVATMAPLGFNVRALGLLAEREPYLVLGSTDALAARFVMLRDAFQPWSDELAQDLSRTNITGECLPAVARNAPPPTLATLAAASERGRCSLVHKAMLAGPTSVLGWTREGLQAHMRTLVAVGLFVNEADAWRGCLLQLSLLVSRKLEWYLARRAAVLEVGGSAEDVLAACCRSDSPQVLLAHLLLFKRAECAVAMICVKQQVMERRSKPVQAYKLY